MIVEPLDILFNTVGQDITFPTFVIKGIANFTTSTFETAHSTYLVEKQDFRLTVKTADVAAHSITANNTFTLVDGIYRYSFKVISPPTNDLTGLSELTINLTNKQLLV